MDTSGTFHFEVTVPFDKVQTTFQREVEESAELVQRLPPGFDGRVEVAVGEKLTRLFDQARWIVRKYTHNYPLKESQMFILAVKIVLRRLERHRRTLSENDEDRLRKVTPYPLLRPIVSVRENGRVTALYLLPPKT